MPNSGSVKKGAGTAGGFVIGQIGAEGKLGVWFGAVAVAAGLEYGDKGVDLAAAGDSALAAEAQ